MKRVFDFCVALSALIVLAVPMLVLCLLVRIKLGSPVLFSQIRPGLYSKPFVMMKFRSMTDERSDSGDLLSDERRITTFGNFLRASSLDELPGLWSVLKGDMSLVGPRPLLMEYLPLYSKEQSRRHDVRPGITGWAQINGRNSLSWDEKFALDVWYVDNRSAFIDLKIIWLTLKKVLIKEGISAPGAVTMPRFKGTHEEKSSQSFGQTFKDANSRGGRPDD